ncbi:DNA replication complex GINS protein PSF2 [Ogataea parapolymorpha DL-1]|uniref:DNA replication complex GINS protein PSF2 n=1 Tax=Ogataea parapolymorpha (strain ATCC 26012 / BCRC 20466 / JCM 22074 / NRRL Y-7560 / DL-1) TaxID=871575 RepID=W1QG65_OGAPD|nr:DNA replication complex GINS protein PSF2 [Ogataea parapolymorpha DL-1]ESX01078.1 DNA replication complex GINS protein PSF2 [Ogataea parapolymorpha DL-1]
MSLPKSYQQNFSPQEINFLAEQELVTVIPRYSMNGAQLIGAKMPKLRALNREQIPLWLATLLKKQEKCNIVVPEWLSVEYLRVRYDEEIKYPSKFSNLPWHWLPIAKKLLDYASDDFIDPPHEIRSLLQDLREVRLVKARKGIRELNHVYIQLDGLSLMEINEIRPFILEVMDQLRKMNDSLKVKAEEEMPRQAAAQMDRDEDSDDDIYQKE